MILLGLGIMCPCRVIYLPADCCFSELAYKTPTQGVGLVQSGHYHLIKILHVLVVRVITKLPNSEQSYKGKVKTQKYIDRQNQSTTGKL